MADTLTINKDNLYKDAEQVYGKKIAQKKKNKVNIGIDIDNEFYDSIVSDGESSVVERNGHISVSLGNGQEASDHICNQYKSVAGRRDTFHVFIPVK